MFLKTNFSHKFHILKFVLLPLIHLGDTVIVDGTQGIIEKLE